MSRFPASPRSTRREFIAQSAVLTGMVLCPGVFGAVAAPVARGKLRLAVIGCGIRGAYTTVPEALCERIVALVDPDTQRIAAALARAKEIDHTFDPHSVKAFADYRVMFDTFHKEIDAVLVATPNHHHALAALMAMQRGKGAYVEKPLAHDIAECRMLAEAAARFKVPTQMGNQGHCGEGTRRLCEYLSAGAIGDVVETHSWTDRQNGGTGARPAATKPPANLDWDVWIGPAPWREYHDGLHPHEWHNWLDFGNGAIGNAAPHAMDGPFTALKLVTPTAVELEMVEGGTAEQYPTASRVRWDVPARGNLPAVKAYFWSGCGSPGKRPPIVLDVEKKNDRNLGQNGTLFVGTKGCMCTDWYGDGPRIMPEELHKAFPSPPKTLPRVDGPFKDFFAACRAGAPTTQAPFAYAAAFVEFMYLGLLATRAGIGNKINWDTKAMRCTSVPEVNVLVHRQTRKGWELRATS